MFIKLSDGKIKDKTTGNVFLPKDDTYDAQRYRDWIEGGNVAEESAEIISLVVKKEDLVEALIKAGLADTLEKMLNQAPAEIRQAWYAYTTINISDPRIVAFFTQANIDINKIITGE
jgi:hypothetical protein